MGTAPCGGLMNNWEVELVEMFFFFLKWSASMSCITKWAKKNGDREQIPNTQENRGKILEMDVKAKAHWKPTHFQCGSQNDYANRDGDANESMMCVLGKHPGVGAVWLQHILITGWWFGRFFIFLYIGNNHPNWLSYFSEGFKPPTRSCYIHFLWSLMIIARCLWPS